MSDRVSASITIGGTLPADLLGQFARIVRHEGLSTDWDGPPFELSDISEGEPLRLMAHQVPWGHFGKLEAFCVANAIPFVRWCASCPGQWGPERVVFTGIGQPQGYDLDEAGNLVVSAEVIDRLGIEEAIADHHAGADFDVPPLRLAVREKETGNG
ncbi:MAG TPA: hypothetical protein PKD99_01840 [Sphingopyxis sp.]|nr:hypothetical protein [Sphingopyxis sp.]HMP43818.1 hypothetical protein [Sphingopyxis sp.]